MRKKTVQTEQAGGFEIPEALAEDISAQHQEALAVAALPMAEEEPAGESDRQERYQRAFYAALSGFCVHPQAFEKDPAWLAESARKVALAAVEQGLDLLA